MSEVIHFMDVMKRISWFLLPSSSDLALQIIVPSEPFNRTFHLFTLDIPLKINKEPRHLLLEWGRSAVEKES